MTKLTRMLFCVILATCVTPAWAGRPDLITSITGRETQSWDAALQIWNWAEPGYQEVKSAALLSDMLREAGFRITTNVAGIPTAFTAEIGSGKPVIGILGEYDALPGLSQAAVPYREPRADVTCGHGCGHHLFGVASASAAIALGEQIQAGQLHGTLRYYGCPAEEGGSAKAFMVREGLFKDLDACVHWHPSSSNSAGDRSSLARIAVKFRFHGQAAHAAGAPEQGRSALDAVELTNYAAELLREHVPEESRIHHVITAGGEAPNVVPAFAEVYYYIRHPKAVVVKDLYARLKKCAEAGALATETRLELVEEGGIVEILPNAALAKVTLKNLRDLNDLQYDEAEREFAIRLQQEVAKPEPLEKIGEVTDRSGTVGMGSTDVGDVSWVVPTTGFSAGCWVPGTPAHSWQAVASGGTTIGKKGMQLAAKVLATTCWDLFNSPDVLKEAQEEHERRLTGAEYVPLIGSDQAPPLDYRKPPPRFAPAGGE
jgi:aminobenzoyl-glutamate utilization protein B